jgi:hypothetical protein
MNEDIADDFRQSVAVFRQPIWMGLFIELQIEPVCINGRTRRFYRTPHILGLVDVELLCRAQRREDLRLEVNRIARVVNIGQRKERTTIRRALYISNINKNQSLLKIASIC